MQDCVPVTVLRSLFALRDVVGGLEIIIQQKQPHFHQIVERSPVYLLGQVRAVRGSGVQRRKRISLEQSVLNLFEGHLHRADLSCDPSIRQKN